MTPIYEALLRCDGLILASPVYMGLITCQIIGAMDPSWEVTQGGAHDARVVLDDWGKLDEFISKLPDPENDPPW
jgi:hypothetical protein